MAYTRLDIHKTPGMLSTAEREYLYDVANELFTGGGTIVDAGALFGASAFSLAAGLADNPNADPGLRPLHSYDWFLHDRYSVELLKRTRGLHQSEGEDFFETYVECTRPVNRWITVHKGDFVTASPPNRPIEILFVDICKSRQLNGRLIEQFLPAMTDGGLLIHQDYHHPHLPHIHVTMEYLANYFLVEKQCINHGDSIVYRKVGVPNRSEIAKCVLYSFSPNEQLHLMQRAMERLLPENRPHVELANVVLLLIVSGPMEAEKEFANVVDKHSGKELHLWDQYVEQVRQRIEAGQ